MFRLIDSRPVNAHQWRRNGDHPDDESRIIQDSSGGEFLSEGKIVGRFIHPNMDGGHYCAKCGNRAKIHGWIDQGNEGLTVCPGDWVVSIGSEYLVLSDNSFRVLFCHAAPVPMQAVSYSIGQPKKPTKDSPVDNSEGFKLDEIVAEFGVSYTEIASNVLACALRHEGAKFTVTGLASCLDPDLYDETAAKEHAYNAAAGKVHQFEQYRQGMNQHRRIKDAHEESASPTIMPVAPMPALDDYFDIGMARRHIMDGHKVAHRDWVSTNEFVFYVPPGKYPASRNGNGTLLGTYPRDMVPYDGYMAMKTRGGSVVPWQPTVYDVLNVGWYLVE